MSKELTPLKALERLRDYENLPSRNPVAYLLEQENLPTYYKIIENALKEKENIENRLDEIFENHNIKSFTDLNERLCDYNELKFDDDINRKKLKALKIIKEVCEFDFLVETINDMPTRYEIHIRRKGKDNIYFPCLAIYPKSQEEFNSLKKVLL